MAVVKSTAAKRPAAKRGPQTGPAVFVLVKGKVCKNSVRYEGGEGGFSIYVPNEIVKSLGNPPAITVTLSN